jgi:hypothetical protein
MLSSFIFLAATTSLISGIGSWYAQKKKEWTGGSPSEKTPSDMNVAQKENEEVFEHIDLNKDD